jgi:hypothetical protein
VYGAIKILTKFLKMKVCQAVMVRTRKITEQIRNFRVQHFKKCITFSFCSVVKDTECFNLLSLRAEHSVHNTIL